MISRREAAALLERHGSVTIDGIRPAGRQMILRAQVTISPRNPAATRLYLLSEKWGGGVTERPTYRLWQRTSASAAAFLVDVAPYLTWLCPAVEVALAFQEQFTREPGVVAMPEYREFQAGCREQLRALTEPIWRQDGEYNPRAKLTIEQVAEIRRRVAGGQSQAATLRAMGLDVLRYTLSEIVTGKSWNPPAGPNPRRRTTAQRHS